MSHAASPALRSGPLPWMQTVLVSASLSAVGCGGASSTDTMTPLPTDGSQATSPPTAVGVIPTPPASMATPTSPTQVDGVPATNTVVPTVTTVPSTMTPQPTAAAPPPATVAPSEPPLPATDVPAPTQDVPGVVTPGSDFALLDPNNPPRIIQLSGNLGTHDPVIVQSPEGFHEFNTGNGVSRKFSTDMINWSQNGSVFQTKPAWINQEVPGHQGNSVWAPDVSFFGGLYHLYYSASTFGSQDSCLGHTVTDDLDSGTWTDMGPVFCSNPGDPFNAIDANVVLAEDGTPWMSFGSHWDGIFMFELDLDGNQVGSEVERIATVPGTRIEAPYIVRRGNFYYLFASYDACCQGLTSTYNVRVTRSTSIAGPYVDDQGTGALQGGGLRLLTGTQTLAGPGHNGILFTEDNAFIVYHAYPNNGAVLRISELRFDAQGWPVTTGP